MRLLLANANTSTEVTDAVVAAARAAAAPGTEIVGATARFGARIIASRVENAIAAHALLDVLAAAAPGCEAVVLAVSYDTALEAARELLDVPVVGMTEAALHTGCLIGGRTGLVTLGARTLPLYRETVERYGLAGRLAGMRAVDAGALDALRDPARVEALLAAEIEALARDGAESIVLGGAALAGWRARLEPRAPVPLVDGIEAGVALAETLVRLGFPCGGGLRGREVSGLSEALTGRLRG
jgi:allantoin racemase